MGEHLFQLNKNKPARYGLLKRFSKTADDIIWFELPCHYCFHYGNAWEEKDGKVVLWGCKAVELDFEMK